MKFKIWYDQRCVKCPECGYFCPAGQGRYVDGSTNDVDACKCYGYLLTDRIREVAMDCDGFRTREQIAEAEEAERRRRKEQEKTRRAKR